MKLVLFLLFLRMATEELLWMLWKISKCLRCISNLGKKYLEIPYDKECVSLQREFYAVVTSYLREEDGEFGLWLMSESKFLQLRMETESVKLAQKEKVKQGTNECSFSAKLRCWEQN